MSLNVTQYTSDLGDAGEDIGDMLTGLTPGLIGFMIGLAVAGGIVLIFRKVFGKVGKSF